MNQLKHLIALMVPLLVLRIEPRQQLLTQSLLGEAYKASHENRIQVTVANQFSMPGSETDCGYHALYNGFAIADLVRASSQEEILQGLSLLESTGKRKQIFVDRDSAWRKRVVEIRADKKAYESIVEALVKTIDPLLSDDEREGAKNIIRNVASDLADKGHLVQERFVQYHIPADLVKEKLRDGVRSKLGDSTVSDKMMEIYEKFDTEDITPFVNVEDIRLVRERDPASWLYSDEIKKLAELANREKLFKTRLEAHNLFVMGDTDGLYKPIALDRRAQECHFKQLQADMQHPDSNVLAVILLYTKESPDLFDWLEPITSRFSWMKPTRTEAEEIDSATASASNGHWITLVVNKIGADTQFITADSGGNRSRLKDKRVHEVIRLLTGDTVKSSSKESKATNQRAAENSWRQWQKPVKIFLSTAAMIAACFFIAKTMNKKEQKAQKNS